MTSGHVLVAAARKGPYWQTALTLAVLAAAGWLAGRHWPVLETGARRLAVADQGWLLAGAAAACATWPCAALAQQGSVLRPLPAGRLVAAQFAASAANQVLPAGLGAGAVTLRFLMRCGLPAGRAATAVGVKATAGGVARAALVAVLAAACPGLPRIPHDGHAGTAGACAALGACLLAAGLLRPRCRRIVAGVTADIRAVHALPRRAAALWGGSAAFAALHACVLIAVTRAVALPLPAARVALLYLAASGAAALLPTPGGLGPLDAALAFALAATTGAPASAAASAVLGYRLLTVWLPLLPGLLVLGVLVRRGTL
ncbi:lysylphosphatidylglycerol synthase domain-containing protein [Streptomyces sp. NPDC003247]|uniref:lysylphosphatidylglycerol synthase domain-containing protein n=1 Tax=Streptomyces sp. NPDC003247 TaxID=3364677 RepID=UPI00369447EB